MSRLWMLMDGCNRVANVAGARRAMVASGWMGVLQNRLFVNTVLWIDRRRASSRAKACCGCCMHAPGDRQCLRVVKGRGHTEVCGWIAMPGGWVARKADLAAIVVVVVVGVRVVCNWRTVTRLDQLGLGQVGL